MTVFLHMVHFNPTSALKHSVQTDSRQQDTQAVQLLKQNTGSRATCIFRNYLAPLTNTANFVLEMALESINKKCHSPSLFTSSFLKNSSVLWLCLSPGKRGI